MLLSKPDLVRLAVKIANAAELKPELLCSLVEIQSGWNPGLCTAIARPFIPLEGLDAREMQLRGVCYGMTQIHGEFARERGFNRDLPELLDPRANLEFACTLLRQLMAESSQRAAIPEVLLHDVLERWNKAFDGRLARLVPRMMPRYEEFLRKMPEETK